MGLYFELVWLGFSESVQIDYVFVFLDYSKRCVTQFTVWDVYNAGSSGFTKVQHINIPNVSAKIDRFFLSLLPM